MSDSSFKRFNTRVFKNEKMSSVLFYCNVKSRKQFVVQKFFYEDLKILKSLGFRIQLANKLNSIIFSHSKFIFIYFYKYGFFAGLIGRLMGKKIIYTGGADFLDREYAGFFRFNLERLFVSLSYLVSNYILVVSENDYRNMKKYCISGEKLIFCTHGIDVKKFVVNDISQKNSNLVSTVVWMQNKENVIRKGVDKSMYMFASLKKKLPDLKYKIVGTIGPGTIYLKRIVTDLGLSDSVIFVGEVSEDEKIQILKTSLFYFQFSIYEGFGIAALEALVSGCIVFHTSAGGLKYTIGQNGIIIRSICELDQVDLEGLIKFHLCNPKNYYTLVDGLGTTYALAIRAQKIKNLLS